MGDTSPSPVLEVIDVNVNGILKKFPIRANMDVETEAQRFLRDLHLVPTHDDYKDFYGKLVPAIKIRLEELQSPQQA